MPKNPLDILRSRIDRLDDDILKLLSERARAAQKIGAEKARRQEEVYASTREQQIMERLAAANKGPLPEEAIDEIFRAIINNCRLLQKPLSIAYFGPEATFTHQAALKHFGRAADYRPLKTIADVFDEVEKGRADYGVVPIENSTEGMVNHTLDMFMESDLIICAERQDPIQQCLMAIQPQLKKIKGVYSYGNALGQCRRWLDANLRGVPVHESASTADAAAHAALHPETAAIASPLAAEIYHLKVLAANIQDARHNRTRFLVIGRPTPQGSTGTGRDKTSLLLSVKDRVGALHDLLSIFKETKINLSKIESRPTKKKAWEYVFFVDMLGHQSDPAVKRALDVIAEHCVFVKVLGSYPRGD